MIEAVQVLDLTTRLAINCLDVEVRLKKIRANNPNRTDLIAEFESEFNVMMDARTMLESFKKQYHEVSMMYNNISKDKLIFQKENEDLKAKVKELQTKLDEVLKF